MEEDNELRSRTVGIRFTPTEYGVLEKAWKNTTCRKLSDYLRKIAFNKPMVIVHRDKSLDDFMTELIQLRKDLDKVGNNFNQAVKKLNTLSQIKDFQSWIRTYELDRKALNQQIETIGNRFQSMSEKWLQ